MGLVGQVTEHLGRPITGVAVRSQSPRSLSLIDDDHSRISVNDEKDA
jgi:hypothetical protein